MNKRPEPEYTDEDFDHGPDAESRLLAAVWGVAPDEMTAIPQRGGVDAGLIADRIRHVADKEAG